MTATPIREATRWGALWRSKNRMDGTREYLLTGPDCLPVMFETRIECRRWIEETHGYIRTRPDLKAEPHGWKLPSAVKVIVRYWRQS